MPNAHFMPTCRDACMRLAHDKLCHNQSSGDSMAYKRLEFQAFAGVCWSEHDQHPLSTTRNTNSARMLHVSRVLRPSLSQRYANCYANVDGRAPM